MAECDGYNSDKRKINLFPAQSNEIRSASSSFNLMFNIMTVCVCFVLVAKMLIWSVEKNCISQSFDKQATLLHLKLCRTTLKQDK